MDLAMGIIGVASMLFLMWVGVADLVESHKIGRRYRAEIRALRTVRAIDQQTQDRLTELLGQGNKIQAIDDMRVVTGLGPKAAEDAVDALDSLNLSEAIRTGVFVPRRDVPATTQEAARKLLAQGLRLQALTLIREEAGLSLPEAMNVANGLSGNQVGPPAG